MLQSNKAGNGTIARLVDYITGEQAGTRAARTERIHYTNYTNLHAADHADAVVEMSLTQDMNTTSKACRTYHLIVSFPLGESPEPNVLVDIEHKLVGALGMQTHQRISALHTDTSHEHLHIALNKIHPVSFANITPGFGKLKLFAVARELEIKHGLQALQGRTVDEAAVRKMLHQNLADPECTWQRVQQGLAGQGLRIQPRGRGLIIVSADGQYTLKPSSLDRAFSRSALEARLGAFDDQVQPVPEPIKISERVSRLEAQSGTESFLSWVRRTQVERIKLLIAHPRADWQSVQQGLAEQGLRIQPRGRGLIIASADGRYTLKPSSLDRAFSRSALEARLGVYGNCRVTMSKCSYIPTPNMSVSAKNGGGLWNEFKTLRTDNAAKRKQRFKDYVATRDNKLQALSDVYKTQRANLWANQHLSKRDRFDISRKLTAARELRLAELRAEFAAQRSEIVEATHTPGWVDYLVTRAQTGEADALQALLSRRRKGKAEDQSDIGISGRFPSGALVTARQLLSAVGKNFRVHRNGDLSVPVVGEGQEGKILIREGVVCIIGQFEQACDQAETIVRSLSGQNYEMEI